VRDCNRGGYNYYELFKILEGHTCQLLALSRGYLRSHPVLSVLIADPQLWCAATTNFTLTTTDRSGRDLQGGEFGEEEQALTAGESVPIGATPKV
jgi:hypothetical protein